MRDLLSRKRSSGLLKLVQLEIPEGKKGKFSIRHVVKAAGTKMPLVTMRDALFSGQKVRSVIFDKTVTFHELLEDKGVWTTDYPQEQHSQIDIVKDFSGRVLVGGLGIGLIIKALDDLPAVKEIVVIEIQKDVIELVWKHLKLKKAKVVQADLFEYLEKTKEKFDYAFYDIWTPTGEHVLKTHIRELRALSEGIVAKQDNIACWMEDVMVGQLYMGLMTTIDTADMKDFGLYTLTDEKFKGYCKFDGTKTPFLKWLRQERPTREVAMKMAKEYATQYPRKGEWMKRWGKLE